MFWISIVILVICTFQINFWRLCVNVGLVGIVMFPHVWCAIGKNIKLFFLWPKERSLTISYLAKINLGIFGNQIEMEKIKLYCRYCHRSLLMLIWCEEFDLLVLLIKNWLDDPIVGFEDKWASKYVDGFGQVEEEILDVMDVECFDEVENHVKDCIQNWDIYSWFWFNVLFMMHIVPF